ncbi:MAG TPA: hypothetical protein VII61_04055 [Ktedonobacteraceae bacterium]|jgi:hypothetical protein
MSSFALVVGDDALAILESPSSFSCWAAARSDLYPWSQEVAQPIDLPKMEDG